MLTNKKQAASGLCVISLVVMVGLTGCSPSGPQALMDGKRLIERGQPASAVRKLREATMLMPTNALAWSYLGLAYQQGGFVTNAVTAYSTALSLSPDAAEIRFNLGCVWMACGQWEQAREQFSAAIVLQKNFAIAWQRLGEAQVRLGDPGGAVQSLGEALRLDAGSPDAWNWLGVAQLKQGRSREAKPSFESALRLRANHGPALLNLAILNQTTLNQPEEALEHYRQYLAFLPNAANAHQVRQVADQLESVIRADAAPAVLDRSIGEARSEPKVTEPSTLTARAVVRTNRLVHREPEPKPAVVAADQAQLQRKPLDQVPHETIRVQPSAPIASSTRASTSVPAVGGIDTPAPVIVPTVPPDVAVTKAAIRAEDSAPNKPGFFSRINPLNLLKKKSREKETTPLPPRNDNGEPGGTQVKAESRASLIPATLDSSGLFPRYRYRLSAAPAKGDHRTAMDAFEKGEKLKKRGKESEALQACITAVLADPSFFEAQFTLGSIYLDRGDPVRALPAFEATTKIQPDSTSARYNFALTLKSAGYPVDSANELLRLLAQDPNDVRAHLALANLYAQQFGDKAQARREYQRVLEIAPGHPQASAIHLWLVQNPL